MHFEYQRYRKKRFGVTWLKNKVSRIIYVPAAEESDNKTLYVPKKEVNQKFSYLPLDTTISIRVHMKHYGQRQLNQVPNLYEK